MPGFQRQSSARFQDAGRAFAVAVYRHEGGWHTGMLYATREGGFAVLHLAWHHDVRVGGVGGPWMGSLWATPAIEPESELVFAGLCRFLEQKYAGKLLSIPYAIQYANTRFDPATGAWEAEPGASGMTCATFVLSTLNAYGLQLLRTEEWATRPGDAEWHLQVVTELAKVDAEQASRVAKELGCARFRPTDVLGGAASSEVPASFLQATRVGELAEREWSAAG